MAMADAKGRSAVEQSLNQQVQEKVRVEHQLHALRRDEVRARQIASSSTDEAKRMEEEAERLERLLGEAKQLTHGINRSRSSASIARRLARSEVEDTASPQRQTADPGLGSDSEVADSPAKRKEAIMLLTQEVKKGGAFRLQRNGMPMILRAFAKEEGQP